MARMHTLITPAAISLIAGLALMGCNDKNPSSVAPQSSPDAHHDHDHAHGDHDHHHHGDSDRQPDVYSGIRGEITQLPDASIPGSELKIRHEQIRDFKTKDGTVSINSRGIEGMMSMTMPFPLGDGITLDGLSVGDKVEFEFVVNWGQNRPAWEITRIETLPADTELDFTNVIVENREDAADGMMDHSDHDHGTDHDGP